MLTLRVGVVEKDFERNYQYELQFTPEPNRGEQWSAKVHDISF